VFIHYTRDLRFDDRPDYGFLKRLIKTISDREKIEMDYQFDWIKKQDVLFCNFRRRVRKIRR
jgi:hypothetical protein